MYDFMKEFPYRFLKESIEEFLLSLRNSEGNFKNDAETFHGRCFKGIHIAILEGIQWKPSKGMLKFISGLIPGKLSRYSQIFFYFFIFVIFNLRANSSFFKCSLKDILKDSLKELLMKFLKHSLDGFFSMNPSINLWRNLWRISAESLKDYQRNS